MQVIGTPSCFGLERHQLSDLQKQYWNLSPAHLVQQAVLRQEAQLSASGAVVVSTGAFTGRSPGDKFLVRYPDEPKRELAWSETAQTLPPETFERLQRKMAEYLRGRDVFVQDLRAGAHPDYAVSIRVISEVAWAGLFARNLFLRLPPGGAAEHVPDVTILHCPGFFADPQEDGTCTGTFIILDFNQGVVLIGGTGYAGEIKKAVFTVLNERFPRLGVLPMHCAANQGESGDVALFFGLSGTGKTTLSSDPARRLIGDDEHGWADRGVFNFEGGCYAKTIRLRAELEPLIWEAVHRFGTVLENVPLDTGSSEPDFDSEQYTENTRAAYPMEALRRAVIPGFGGHPRHIFFLTADAFGVLPPLARLTPQQAIYYFLSGYTSKIAGTERGLGSAPQATFSTCFAAPFLPLEARAYADLLARKIERHHAQVWLLNTGWTGGPYGVGKRISLPWTRAMVRGVLENKLDSIPLHRDERFGLWIPEECPGVPAEVLTPERTWSDVEAYRQQADELIGRFQANFKKYTSMVSPEVASSGPGSEDVSGPQ